MRDYGADVPRIEALAAELNQVWTNLIDNALDAMDGRGTLRVSTRVDRGAVVVEIGDTGAGMSPETAEHAFDPFYTTKGVGEGTGLGLDISRRIVDRHRGDISIGPGRARRCSRCGSPREAPTPSPGCLSGPGRSVTCMRAVQITRFGGPEVLDIVDLPDPAPGAGSAALRRDAPQELTSPTPTRSRTPTSPRSSCR